MFAPRYFGVRHFAPRHFAPNTEVDIPEVKPGSSAAHGFGGYISPGDRRRSDLAKDAFDQREIEWRDDLGRTLEAAFNQEFKKAKEPVYRTKAKPVKKIRKRVTRAVFDYAKACELELKINEISKLVDAYAEVLRLHWLDIARRQDEDAIILLLMDG